MRNLRILVTTGILLVTVATTTKAAVSRVSEQQQLAQIERVTESIRHLGHTHHVRALFPSSKEFGVLLKHELRTDNPDAEIELGQRESVLLGFLSQHQSLHKIVYGGLTAQVLGFYDYHNHVLYVPNDSNGAFGPQRYVIAHEYTHALQDQHYGLRKLLPDEFALQYRNSDAVAARHALTEGDAVNLETLYIHRTYSTQEMSALVKAESARVPGPVLPKAIQRQFYFPYTTGVDFVTHLYSSGGMAAVDAAYHRLPKSTFEIMHPAAYLAHWKPASVALHRVNGFESWKQVDDDVFGAFGYNLLLWQSLGVKRADGITDAYRGDRYVFLEHGDQRALLMKSVWTVHASANAVRSALVSALRVRFPNAHVAHSGASATVTYAGGTVYARVDGPRMTVAFALTKRTALQLGKAITE